MITLVDFILILIEVSNEAVLNMFTFMKVHFSHGDVRLLTV